MRSATSEYRIFGISFITATNLMAIPEKGKKLGDYELVQRISDGAQATIYEATASDGSKVAIKLFKSVDDDETAEIRFSREAEILRRL